MTGPIDDERTRVWLFNLHRWACKMDCERSLSEYVARVKLICKAIRTRCDTTMGVGILECFADSEFLQRGDIFWDDFKTYVESGNLNNVRMSSSLEEACTNLRDGSLVGTGYFLEHAQHTLYKFAFRDPDWYCVMRDYWPFRLDVYVPTSSQVVYLRNRILQAAQNLTLAIRLKNEMIKIQERDPEEKISEVRLVKKDCQSKLPWHRDI